MGYDRALTLFSPEGRLFQVEYALEAVRRGTLAIGIKSHKGAAIVVQKKVNSKLMDPETINKIYQVDAHIGCAISGLHADARVLVDWARVQAQVHRLTYDEPVRLQILVKKIADVKQMYTQHAGVRPFGSALLLIAVDQDGPQLMTTSPSGTYWSWKSVGVGFNENEAKDFLEKEYSENMSLDEILVLAARALADNIDEELSADTLQIAYIDAEDRQLKMATKEKLEQVLAKAGAKA